MQDRSTMRVAGGDVAAHPSRARTFPFAANGSRTMRGVGAR